MTWRAAPHDSEGSLSAARSERASFLDGVDCPHVIRGCAPELLDVPWVPVDRCVRIQSACCRSCRGHSKDGPQVAGQRHVETVAATGCNATRYQWLLQKSLPWGLSVRDHHCDSTTLSLLSTLFSPFLYCYGAVSIGQVSSQVSAVVCL